MGWQEDQHAAIARQKAAHAALANGSEPSPVPDTTYPEPEARYTKAQALDYFVQLDEILETGLGLPTGGDPTKGLTFEDDARAPLSEDTRKGYAKLVAELRPRFTEDEIAEARARLDENIANHVMLDPATAESV